MSFTLSLVVADTPIGSRAHDWRLLRQTSIRSGTLLEMGKGFHAVHGVLGRDLGELVMDACRRRVSLTHTRTYSR